MDGFIDHQARRIEETTRTSAMCNAVSRIARVVFRSRHMRKSEQAREGRDPIANLRASHGTRIHD
jgi:hypothetical protein